MLNSFTLISLHVSWINYINYFMRNVLWVHFPVGQTCSYPCHVTLIMSFLLAGTQQQKPAQHLLHTVTEPLCHCGVHPWHQHRHVPGQCQPTHTCNTPSAEIIHWKSQSYILTGMSFKWTLAYFSDFMPSQYVFCQFWPRSHIPS